jgi:Ca2+-transporting ATPase
MMITGDHPTTAAVIAADLGIAVDARAVTGGDIQQAGDDSFAQTVKEPLGLCPGES